MTKLIKMTRLPHRHFICIWGSEILMAAGIMGAAIGLSWLDSLEIRRAGHPIVSTSPALE